MLTTILFLVCLIIGISIYLFIYNRRHFELGPVQRAWIKSLREHPERQAPGRLGKKVNDDEYTACCLGEGGLIAGVCHWDGDRIRVIGGSRHSLSNESYKALGLMGSCGETKDMVEENSLANLNDRDVTWPEIADILEKNPHQYFTHAV